MNYDNEFEFDENAVDGFNGGPVKNNKKDSDIDSHEIEALERHLNHNTSRYSKKKEACLQAVNFWLSPFLTASGYQKYTTERKRLKALEERKNYIMRILPEKLGLENIEKIYLENAIETLLSPPVKGEEWDCEDNLEDMKFDWICRDLGLAPGDAIVVTAEPFTGKTYLASHIALSVMSGTPIFGKYAVQKRGKVAHLNYDAADSKMVKIGYRRLANGINYTWKKGELYYESPMWKLNHEDAYKNLKEICTGRTFCIIDSLRACFDGEENSSEVVQVVALANRVSEETGCAIFFIAHTGKGGVGNKGLDATRGSSAIAAAVGSAWNLEKSDAEKSLKLSCVKGRLGQFAPIIYQYSETGEYLENINKTYKVEMTFVGGEPAKLTIRDQIIEALKAGAINKTDLKEKITGRDVSINEEIDKMEAEKIIKVDLNPKNKREKIVSLTDVGAWQ